MAPKQTEMIDRDAYLPIFSGVPLRGREERFAPIPVPPHHQLTLDDATKGRQENVKLEHPQK